MGDLFDGQGRAAPEDFPGAPDWFIENYLPHQNDFNEAVSSQFSGGISSVNTVDKYVTVDLVHGTQTRVKNPLGRRLVGIEAVRCIGVSLGTNGQPSRALYQLGTPRIDWLPAGTGDDQVLVTADFPRTVSGAIGEHTSSVIVAASAVTLSTGATKTVTSIALTAGTWIVSGAVAYGGGAITGTITQAHVATVTDAVTGSVLGESWFLSPTMPTAASNSSIAIPPFRVVLTAAASRYLTATGTFTVGTMSAYGSIVATRMIDAYSVDTPRGRVTLKMLGG